MAKHAHDRQADKRKALEELAEFRGLTVKRMKAAQANVSTSGTGSDVRKPHGAKCKPRDRWGDGSTKSGKPRIVSGKAYVPEGTFIQYGARTKEGTLEQRKQIAPGKPGKPWRQGYDIAGRKYGITLHDNAGM